MTCADCGKEQQRLRLPSSETSLEERRLVCEVEGHIGVWHPWPGFWPSYPYDDQARSCQRCGHTEFRRHPQP